MATNSSNNTKVPEAEFRFRHTLPIQLRFNDMDMLGHVNNTTYLKFLDLAKCRYMEDILPGGLDWSKINVVVAHIDCDFYAPTFFNEKIAVCSTVTHVGEKSFRMEQRVYDTETNQIKCVGRTVMVGYDLETGETMRISQEWRDALEKYEGRAI